MPFTVSASVDTFQVTGDSGKQEVGTAAFVTSWAVVTVTYTYVPEPSSLALLGLLALPAALLRRRRRAA